MRVSSPRPGQSHPHPWASHWQAPPSSYSYYGLYHVIYLIIARSIMVSRRRDRRAGHEVEAVVIIAGAALLTSF